MLPGSLFRRPWWFRYSIAFLTVALATGGVGGLIASFELPAFLLYVIAVALSAMYGGIGPGLAAAALALLASYYLFLPPYFSFTSEQTWLPLLASYVAAVVLSSCVARWQHSRMVKRIKESGFLSSGEEE